MHAAEHIPLPPAITDYWTAPAEVQRAYDPEAWDIGYGGTPEDAWQKVWLLADQNGLLRHETIGAASCHYFPARSVVGMYMQWRETDPYGLYGVPKPQR